MCPQMSRDKCLNRTQEIDGSSPFSSTNRFNNLRERLGSQPKMRVSSFASALQTAASAKARAVRVQIITPPGALTRNGQKQLVDDVTRIVAEICGDRSQTQRTWVLLTKAAEGGGGINGTAYGREEFAALARRR